MTVAKALRKLVKRLTWLLAFEGLAFTADESAKLRAMLADAENLRVQKRDSTL